MLERVPYRFRPGICTGTSLFPFRLNEESNLNHLRGLEYTTMMPTLGPKVYKRTYVGYLKPQDTREAIIMRTSPPQAPLPVRESQFAFKFSHVYTGVNHAILDAFGDMHKPKTVGIVGLSGHRVVETKGGPGADFGVCRAQVAS